MISDFIINQWSDAFFQLVLEKKQVKEYHEEANTLVSLFQDNKDFIYLLANSNLKSKDKNKIVNETFTDFGKYTKNLLLLLIDKKMIHSVIKILKSFSIQCNNYFGIKYGIVYSVIPLSAEQMASLEKTMLLKVKSEQIKLSNQIDESLIGGIRIKIRNDVFDGSIKGQIEQLRNKFKKNNTE